MGTTLVPDDEDVDEFLLIDAPTIAPKCVVPIYPPFAGLADLPAITTLKSRNQWVAWKYVVRPNKAKPDKVPIKPSTGRAEDPHKPSTWGSYDEAAGRARRNGLAGVGFVLTADDGLCGIDLDNCRNPDTGELEAWAAEIVATAETYTEVSPSSCGLRMFALGKPSRTVGSGPHQVEIYGKGRYLTVTGQHLAGTPDQIKHAPKTLAKLLARVETFRSQKGDTLNAARDNLSVAPVVSDTPANVAIAKAMLAAIDQKLQRGPNHDIGYDEWLRVVFALLSTGWTCAVELAREWSAIGSKWDEVAFNSLVNSFDADRPNGIGHGSLDFIARKYDYDGPRLAQAEAEGPLPLFPDLPPSAPYPAAALGPVLGEAARAIVRKIQVPEAMAAQSVLSAASLAAQAHADVRLPYGQTRPLSLFLVTVAASGDRKSSADNEALAPVMHREKLLREQYETEVAQWQAARAAWSVERKRIEGDKKLNLDALKTKLAALGNEPPRPLAPFLVTGDLTVEGLTKNWGDAHAALGIFTSEGGTFTGGHAMSEDNRLKTAAMLSKVWDGDPVKRVRAGDGVTILPGRRLSMHIMVQPEAAAGFLGNSVLRDQGLLSRILVAAPASLAGTRLHRAPEPADARALAAYNRSILTLLDAPLRLNDNRNELIPRVLDLDTAATALWIKFRDRIEQELGSTDKLAVVRDFGAKAAEHAARLAGVLTIVENESAATIGRDAMAAAVELASWYVAEALRLHHAGRRDPKLVQAEALRVWIVGLSEPVISRRDVMRLGPSATRSMAAAKQAIAELVNHGWLDEVPRRPGSYRLVPEASA